ncbi:MAG TPA: GDSL-type esterase/lipase family protein [Capillimicrobium sp.]|nr:GDSL-type esterase/lipase family protein [Capillimicrobium sp.]
MRPGLVALGDSITNGEGAPMLGVRPWSWTQWLATALELPYTGLAENGARAPDLLARQLPRLDGPYAIGCLWIGVNDVRSVDFDLAAYAGDLAAAVDGVAAACERVVMPTIPLDLGRPRAGEAKVGAANAAIAREAARVGAVVVDLARLRGWRLVLPDAVHLTAAGQLLVADLAAGALAAAGATVPARPSALAERDDSPLGAARYALTGHAAALARDWRRRAVEGAARRLRR